jgi:LmbE family N-acetylglucosaminyl deacetylase
VLDVDDLGSLVAVFAHPDDEAYLAGACMAAARDAGRRVVCVTATSGELGFPDDDPRSPAERRHVRERELAACLETLGVEEHRGLGYPDGGCAGVDDADAVAVVRAVLAEVRPDTVLTFGPDGQTLHPDHIAVSRWATLACRTAEPRPRLLYATMTPEWVRQFADAVPIDQVRMVAGAEPPTTPAEELTVWFAPQGASLDRKVAALRCQSSQIDELVAQVGEERFAALVRDEMFRDPTPADWPD